MQNVAEVIIKALATKPDGVVINTAHEGEKTVLTVQVDPTDLGRVIGRQGRTINAVRTIVKAAGLKSQQFVSLDLMNPENESHDSFQEEIL